MLGALNWLVYSSSMWLLQPFAQPERTASIQAWHKFGPEQTDIVFLGDSRTGCAVIPGVVDEELRSAGHDLRSYNLAQPGADVLANAGMVDHLFGVGGHPKLMVLGVGKHQTTPEKMADFQRFRSNPQLAYHLFRVHPCWQNACTMGMALLRGPQVAIQLPLQLLPRYRHSVADAGTTKGFTALSVPLLQNDATAAESSERDGAFQPNRTVEAAIAHTADAAREQHCRLIVINTPTTRRQFRLEREQGYSEYLAWLSVLIAEQGVPFVDMNSPPWLPPDNDFGDTNHLSAAGAERFSRMVTQRLLIPELEAIRE